VYLYMNWIADGRVAAGSAIWVAVALFIFTVVYAFLAYRWWDLPLRKAFQRWDGERKGCL
jgi:peptidoglycan/LPS O-acetylase OafA/YrhL